MRFQAANAKAMNVPAAAIAKILKSGTVLLVEGDVGAGKTTLVKAIMKQMGWKGKVVSPTFTIACKYQVGQLSVYHLDLYRLTKEQVKTGFLSDYFDNEAVSIVEWPEKLPAELIASKCVKVRISFTAEGKSRVVEVRE